MHAHVVCILLSCGLAWGPQKVNRVLRMHAPLVTCVEVDMHACMLCSHTEAQLDMFLLDVCRVV